MLRLSDKYGVNPSVTHCLFCGKETGVALFGRTRGDVEAPRDVVLDDTPCPECQAGMDLGITFFRCADDGTEENPKFTGQWCVVAEEYVKRLAQASPGVFDRVFEVRKIFIPDTAWKTLGLPDGPTPSEDTNARSD